MWGMRCGMGHSCPQSRCARGAVSLLIATGPLGGCDPSGDRTARTSREVASAGDGATAQTPLSAAEAGWFVDRTGVTGIEFRYDAGATGALNLPEITGSGVALFDADGDGDLDVYLTNGNHELPAATSGGDVTNRLFRREPDGRFTDVTERSGLGDTGYGMGVCIGDVDNDGDADVYVTNYGPDRLYRNRGDGTFEDVTESAGIDVPGWSCSAAFLDYDRDGFLDLFVTQYVVFDESQRCLSHTGAPAYCGPRAFPPATDVLLRNGGDGTFRDVSDESGVGALPGPGLGVVCEDLDDDGWVDVYVANDGAANHLWLNRRDGTFEETATRLGVAYNLHGQPEGGMGVVAEDLDDDGRCDLFVTHLRSETNTLYLHGPSGFRDETGRSGLGRPSMVFTGFGTCGFDVELDGDVDLAVVNGRVQLDAPRPDASVGPPWDALAEPNLMFLNEGGARFRAAGVEAADFGRDVEVSRGLAMGDLDNDGDIDLVVSNIEGPVRIFENVAPRRGRWLLVRAVDPALRRIAVGARITVSAGGRSLHRTARRSSGYLSSHDPRVHFGLGDVDAIDAIEVRWPDGRRERFAPRCVDCVIEVRRGDGVPVE